MRCECFNLPLFGHRGRLSSNGLFALACFPLSLLVSLIVLIDDYSLMIIIIASPEVNWRASGAIDEWNLLSFNPLCLWNGIRADNQWTCRLQTRLFVYLPSSRQEEASERANKQANKLVEWVDWKNFLSSIWMNRISRFHRRRWQARRVALAKTSKQIHLEPAKQMMPADDGASERARAIAMAKLEW